MNAACGPYIIACVISATTVASTIRTGDRVESSGKNTNAHTAALTAPSAYTGRRPVYAIGAASAAVWGFAFFPLLSTRSTVLIVLATVVALITHAMMYGPQAAFIAEMFSTELRYSGASMGYQIAGILGGAIAPIVSIALVGAFGTAYAVSVYLAAMMVLTLIALKLAPETARTDLHDEPVHQ